jgi:nucleoside-diphosphate-sugar epimerase
MVERVLVTGANGFVGRFVCRKLIASGFQPIAGVRDLGTWPELHREIPGLCEVSVLGDLSAIPDLRNSLPGTSVIVHLAARVHIMTESAADPLQEFRRVNVNGTRSIALAAAAAGVRRLVFASTVKIHGESTSANPFCEQTPSNPQDPYAISKWEAEETLRTVSRETGLEVVVVRPPLVYGPGVRGNFLRLIELVDRAVPLPWPKRANCRSMIGVDNLADFLVRCVADQKAAGQSFLVKDSEDVSTRELMTRLARLLNRPDRLVRFPESLIRLAAKFVSRQDTFNRLFDSLVIDSTHAQQLLEWSPPRTIDEGLAATVRWYQESRHSARAKRN